MYYIGIDLGTSAASFISSGKFGVYPSKALHAFTPADFMKRS